MNKIEKCYADAKRDVLKPVVIARDLGITVEDLETYYAKADKKAAKALTVVAETAPEAPETAPAVKRSKLDMFARNKKLGVVGATAASSEAGDDSLKAMPRQPTRDDCIRKIYQEEN